MSSLGEMMLRKTPLKRKREKPRRNEGRVKHNRMRETGSPLESFHVARVRKLPCCVPGCRRPAIAHHIMVVRAGMLGQVGDHLEKVTRRDDRFVAPLCPGHHNGWNDSVHLLGSEAKFKKVHGIELLAIAVAEWNISVGEFNSARGQKEKAGATGKKDQIEAQQAEFQGSVV
jgi:hypothetical protein